VAAVIARSTSFAPPSGETRTTQRLLVSTAAIAIKRSAVFDNVAEGKTHLMMRAKTNRMIPAGPRRDADEAEPLQAPTALKSSRPGVLSAPPRHPVRYPQARGEKTPWNISRNRVN
jgi:hypothetical protein